MHLFMHCRSFMPFVFLKNVLIWIKYRDARKKPDNENESESEIEIEIDLYKFVLLIHLRIHNLIKSSLLLLFVKNTIRVIFSNGSKIKNCCFYVFFC